jgi:hypothetical protein
MAHIHLTSSIPLQINSAQVPNLSQTCSQRRRRWRRSAATNLGELERFAIDPGMSLDYQPPVSTYVPEARFDGPVATVSIVLFLLLTAIASERILGLQAVLNRKLLAWTEKRAYERRNETIDAREKLEASYDAALNEEDDIID